MIECCGGSFELHESLLPETDTNKDDPVYADCEEVFEINKTGSIQRAAKKLEALYREHPHHTEVIALLAERYSKLRNRSDAARARALVNRLVEIEPNSIRYQALRALRLMDSRRLMESLAEFEKFRKRFPHAEDVNEFGITGYLYAGKVEPAEALLNENPLPQEKVDRFLSMIDLKRSTAQEYALLEQTL